MNQITKEHLDNWGAKILKAVKSVAGNAANIVAGAASVAVSAPRDDGCVTIAAVNAYIASIVEPNLRALVPVDANGQHWCQLHENATRFAIGSPAFRNCWYGPNRTLFTVGGDRYTPASTWSENGDEPIETIPDAWSYSGGNLSYPGVRAGDVLRVVQWIIEDARRRGQSQDSDFDIKG